jgi:Lar family restriction alleviation protein
MTDTDLLPCPFCGQSDMLTIDFIAGDDWCVECDRCHVTQHAVWPNKYSAIMKWNTRTPSSTRANERGE